MTRRVSIEGSAVKPAPRRHDRSMIATQSRRNRPL